MKIDGEVRDHLQKELASERKTIRKLEEELINAHLSIELFSDKTGQLKQEIIRLKSSCERLREENTSMSERMVEELN